MPISLEAGRGQPQWEANIGPQEGHREVWVRGPEAFPEASNLLLLEPKFWDPEEAAQWFCMQPSPITERRKGA